MLQYQELTTEKYVKESLDQQIKELRRLRNRKALQDFLTFLFGLGAIAAAVYAVQEMPTWLPIVKGLLGTAFPAV